MSVSTVLTRIFTALKSGTTHVEHIVEQDIETTAAGVKTVIATRYKSFQQHTLTSLVQKVRAEVQTLGIDAQKELLNVLQADISAAEGASAVVEKAISPAAPSPETAHAAAAVSGATITPGA